MTGGGDDDAPIRPLALDGEMKNAAPGLRVGESAWKWPPVWPYDRNFFKRKAELENAGAQKSAINMMSMQGVSTESEAEAEEATVFDSLGYWEDNREVATDLDARVVEKITNHYSFYLRDGMSVLEMGAAEASYLPADLVLQSHVGVGAVQAQMDGNPSLTASFVADLNGVAEDAGLASEEWAGRIEDGAFDAVIMANTIEFLNSPREVFKSAWKALKPGGMMIVPFLSKDAYPEKFDAAFTKQWRDMSDDQHMWVAGSFFQFSAGEGWEGLTGFDISPPEADDKLNERELPEILDRFKPKLNDGKPPGAYVVQARKRAEAEIDGRDAEAVIRSKMWMMPTLEDRDKKLVAPRLARAYELLDGEDRERMMSHIDSLPAVFESLIKMDQFSFSFGMQAQLAADLVGDPDFVGSPVQINNMKMGLGLRKPSKEFWAPVGKATAAMAPEDKVNLLAYIVPRFGSADAGQEAALAAFVSGLEPTCEVVRTKCPGLKERDVQLLGSELLASEVLVPGRSTRAEFAAWLGALTEVDLEFVLAKRKSFKEDAVREREADVEAREGQVKRVEERRERIREQVMEARERRSVIFLPGTGKFEKYEDKSGPKLPGGLKLPGFN